MEIKAAYPSRPWSDLVDALEPNGRFLDTEVAPAGQSYEPIGVEKQSMSRPVRRGPASKAITRPAGKDAEADMTEWFALSTRANRDPGRRRNRPPDLRVPPGLRDHAVRQAGADAARERLDGRPVPGRSVAAGLQPGTPGGRLCGADGRRPRSRAGLQQAEHRPRLQRRGRRLLRGQAPAPRQPAQERQRHRLHPDMSQERRGRRSFTARRWSSLAPHSVELGGTGPELHLGGREPHDRGRIRPDRRERDRRRRQRLQGSHGRMEPDTATYTTTSQGFTLLGLPTVSATGRRPVPTARSTRGCGMSCPAGRSA